MRDFTALHYYDSLWGTRALSVLFAHRRRKNFQQSRLLFRNILFLVDRGVGSQIFVNKQDRVRAKMMMMSQTKFLPFRLGSGSHDFSLEMKNFLEGADVDFHFLFITFLAYYTHVADICKYDITYSYSRALARVAQE